MISKLLFSPLTPALKKEVFPYQFPAPIKSRCSSSYKEVRQSSIASVKFFSLQMLPNVYPRDGLTVSYSQ